MDSVISGVYDTLYGLVEWLADALNICPFEDWITMLEGFDTGLGWLNWFIPVDAIINLMGAWAAALLIYYVISLASNKVNVFTK